MGKYQNQGWLRKFSNAFRGIWICASSQNSFWIHIPVAIVVAIAAVILKVNQVEGILLALAITLVMSLELLNTALEFLAREVTAEESTWVKDSLDAASGAVLVGSLGAAVVGVWILFPKLLLLISGG